MQGAKAASSGRPRRGELTLKQPEYRTESAALDAELLAVMADWQAKGAGISDAAFDSLALRIFAHQLRYNAPYARFCGSLGITLTSPPSGWEEIPPVPATAFKDARLATFDPCQAALRFETSGTTQERAGVHFMESTALYDAALLAGFKRAILPDHARLRYLCILNQPAERPHSSLAYMMGRVAARFGDGKAGWFVRRDDLLVDAFTEALHSAMAQGVAVCIAGTAFGLLNLIDALAVRTERFALPAGSRIMETGGFKGRTRTLDRREFYLRLGKQFGLDHSAIIAEYGMTELTSQYYDSLESRIKPERVKTSPPWLRARVLNPAGMPMALGEAGTIVHVDLANRSSVLALATDDRAYRTERGFVLLGRSDEAIPRGCSLDADDLRAPRMPAELASRNTTA